jgi:cell division septation protein DedD
MLSRALIVLLIVLNAGVALWWATRPSAVAREAGEQGNDTSVETHAGVARLQLLREAPHLAATHAIAAPPQAAAPATPAEPLQATTPAEVAVAQRCFAIGPFTDAQSLAAARAQLQPLVASLRTRESPASSARGWRVLLPPLADRAAAQAMAERIKAAGFNDYLVVPGGDEANSIALGRYGSEPSARQREATLRAAGFQARAEPLGQADPRTWLDVAVADAGFDPARARRAIGAAQANPLDCKALR